MKVTVIHGANHKGSTYNLTRILTENLALKDRAEITEFFLPKDLPEFCSGCFSCISKGEENCPHYNNVSKIAEHMFLADLIILDSPVYCCDVSGQMKTFIDHLGYLWMSHRPHPSMFCKVGVAISTAAGIGTVHTNKTMKKSLKYWGVKKTFTFGAAVAAMKFKDIKPKRLAKIAKRLRKLSFKISKTVRNKHKKPGMLTRIFFYMMKSMQKGNDWNGTDRDYWKAQGWLDGKNPW